jgi:hypothetical protein
MFLFCSEYTGCLFFQANSVFGKTMQNVRDYSTVKLHTSAEKALKAISKPTFKNYTILGEDLVQTNHFTPTIVHDKPIAIGFSILELVIFIFHTPCFKDLKIDALFENQSFN